MKKIVFIFILAFLCLTNWVNAQIPVVSFTASDSLICHGQCVTFHGTATNGPILNWSWTCSGGTPSSSSSQNPTICYNVPGFFDVTLTALNASGTGVLTKTAFINVIPYADPSISPDGPFCLADEPFNLSAATLGGVWKGDGIIDSLAGTFSPWVAGTGTHWVYYYLGEHCVSYDSLLILVESCSISGKAYIDLDSDSVSDVNEPTLNGIAINVFKNGIFQQKVYTDSNGIYRYYGNLYSTYKLMIDTTHLAALNHYVYPHYGYYNNIHAPAGGLNFGLMYSSLDFDLWGRVTGHFFRPGFNAVVWVNADNYGCLPVSGKVKLVLDPLLDYQYSNPPPDIISNDTLIWNFTNMLITHYFHSHVIVKTSLQAHIGDSVFAKIFITPLAGDLNPSDNADSNRFLVTGSFDPNAKEVSPAGIGAPGWIAPLTRLNYTVFFQNTGNDTAFNISIVDTLDSDLNTSSFFLESASHPLENVNISGNVVTFVFNNIMLPDSGDNQTGSNGYIRYSITPKTSLPNATQITNRAWIFFDYNAGMATNKVLNTIGLTIGEEEIDPDGLALYPNPASDRVFIEIPFTKQNGRISVWDIRGRLLIEKTLNTGKNEIDVSDLAPGVYLVKVHSSQMNLVKKLIKE